MYWWVALGYPDAFDLGKDGFFPRSGQVIKYYRERKMNDKHKAWKPSDLATALGLSEMMIRNIENKDAVLSNERRQFLSKLFGIPPILLGVITSDQIDALLADKGLSLSSLQSHNVAANTHHSSIDIEAYRVQISDLWRTHRQTAHSTAMVTALTSLDDLYRVLPHTSKQQTDIQSLLCDYHQFISALLSEQCKHDLAIEHLIKANRFSPTGSVHDSLIAQRHGLTLWKANRVDEALDKFNYAWQFESNLSPNARGSFLLESCRAKASEARNYSLTDQMKIVSVIDLVGSIARRNYIEDDSIFRGYTKLDVDCYHLYKSSALILMGWYTEADEELNLIKGFPGYLLRQVYYDILQAQLYTSTGEYSNAATLAESALIASQEANSDLNISRVEHIYRQLKQSSYRHNAGVARLEYLLYYKQR